MALQVMLVRLGRVSGAFVAVLYAAFSLTDMVLSLAAFHEGVAEANPLLAWLMPNGCFVPFKLLVTALIACLIAHFYPRRTVQPAAWLAVLLTVVVDGFHLWGLSVV
ncbi:MAG: DUF5658 family protein [Armatimonadota bacterium]